MFLTPLRLSMAASPFIRLETTWTTDTPSTLTATGGVSDGNNLESWAALIGAGTLAQSTVGDRPQIETGDVDGLVMSKHSDTEHLAHTPTDTLRHFVCTIYDYRSGSPRRVLAIDTDAVTDKPAIEFFIEDSTT